MWDSLLASSFKSSQESVREDYIEASVMAQYIAVTEIHFICTKLKKSIIYLGLTYI